MCLCLSAIDTIGALIRVILRPRVKAKFSQQNSLNGSGKLPLIDDQAGARHHCYTK
jgi:hypothetical protein|tara:strand:+ start:13952 stop:14119 length:168 start_codon:yes stop_codon:yes gene_type:complete